MLLFELIQFLLVCREVFNYRIFKIIQLWIMSDLQPLIIFKIFTISIALYLMCLKNFAGVLKFSSLKLLINFWAGIRHSIRLTAIFGMIRFLSLISPNIIPLLVEFLSVQYFLTGSLTYLFLLLLLDFLLLYQICNFLVDIN